VIRCLLEYRVDEGQPWLYRAAFAYGLGITNTWAMLGFLPLFVAALAWIKGALVWNEGKGLRFFFNPRFLGRMLLWGSAGLLLYLLLPVTRSWGDSAVPFWSVLKANLGTQRRMLLGLYYSLSTQDRLVQLLISLVPIFVIGIRWGSSSDASRRGTILTRLLFHLLHAFLMVICIWVALEPPFSPRSKGLGTFLPSYTSGRHARLLHRFFAFSAAGQRLSPQPWLHQRVATIACLAASFGRTRRFGLSELASAPRHQWSHSQNIRRPDDPAPARARMRCAER
jgi:hypothetical protein